jgi:hypothetical protein
LPYRNRKWNAYGSGSRFEAWSNIKYGKNVKYKNETNFLGNKLLLTRKRQDFVQFVFVFGKLRSIFWIRTGTESEVEPKLYQSLNRNSNKSAYVWQGAWEKNIGLRKVMYQPT